MINPSDQYQGRNTQLDFDFGGPSQQQEQLTPYGSSGGTANLAPCQNFNAHLKSGYGGPPQKREQLMSYGSSNGLSSSQP